MGLIRHRFPLPLIVGAALLAACGGQPAAPAAPAAQPGAAATQPPAASKPLRHVVFRLPFYMAGYDAPFILAKERGYYSQGGLDLDIQEGRGSTTTVQTVANGGDTYGFADAGTAAVVASKGAPVVVISGLLQKTPLGFIFHPGHPMKTADDIRGRTIIADAGSAGFQLLPAVLGKVGLKEADIKKDFVSPQAQATTFNSNPSFVVVGNNNSTYITMLGVDPKAEFINFADFGVNPYGLALITTKNEIASHPDDVRAFVAASIKGWEDALKDPKVAVDATLQAYPQQKAQVIEKGLTVSFDLLRNPDTQGKPLGWMTDAGWKDTIDLMHEYGGLKDVQPASTYYTNQFEPQS